MTSVPALVPSFNFATDPAPTSRVNAAALEAEFSNIRTWSNTLLAALNELTRDDDELKDQEVRIRNCHAELIALMASRGDWQPKAPVKCATTENRALTGGGTVDGYVLVNADRILVKDQTTATENGIWVVNTAGAWARATDADGDGELDNAFVQVLNGTVNGSTAWVVAGEDLTPGTDDINWAAYAWQGVQPGAGGSGGSLGINVKSSPYLATGDGVADDKAAIEAAIAAADALGGGVVYFPRGTYCISGRISVPENVELVGESRAVSIIKATTIAAPGLDLDGDHVTLRGLQFVSQDANRFMVKSNNVNHPLVVNCWFNRAHVILGNDTDTELVGGGIENNLFTGSYLPWVASVNVIESRGLKGVRICGNQMIGVVSPYRFMKVQASTFYLTGEVGDQYTNGAVITGNLMIGEMTSGKQVIDLFHGVGNAVFSHNIMRITGTGTGFSVFLEQKAGDTPSNLFSAKTTELSITDNVLDGNPTDSLISVYGAYSLAWEGEEQSVTISRNIIKAAIPGTMTRGLEFRGVHHAKAENNQIFVSGYGTIFRVLGAGSCKTVNIANNTATAGQIYVWGNAVTSGGDAYTGATEQINVGHNTLKNFRSDHGGIEVINMVGTPDLTAIGNNLDSDLGNGTLALIYLSNNTMKNVVAVGNIGDCGEPVRNRLLETTSTHTLKHEYFNSWQTKILLEFDDALNRVTIGDSTAGVVEYNQMGPGSTHERYFRYDGVTRSIEQVSATAYLMFSYDVAGVLIDNWLNVSLGAGGRITTTRPIDVGGVVRPTSDGAHTLGDSSLRWSTIFGKGGITLNLVNRTNNATPADADTTVLQDVTGASIVTSLAAVTDGRNGKHLWLSRVDNSGNTWTLQRSGSDTILEGVTSTTSITVGPGETVHLVVDFANARYRVLSRD